MGFFDSISRGVGMTIASIRIVMKEPWMIILPIISGLLMIALIASFIILPLMNNVEINDTVLLVEIVVLYFVGYFVFYFTQSMVVLGAKERFSGKDPTLGNAFNETMTHLPTLTALSLIGATVGLITSLIGRSKNGRPNLIGQLIAAVIGIAWTIISYFSLPIILNENAGVFQSFKRSTELVKATWGEGIAANISLILLYVPGLAILALGYVLNFIPLIIVGLLLYLIGYVISIPVKGVISQALYVYATKKTVPTGFEEEQMTSAFVKK